MGFTMLSRMKTLLAGAALCLGAWGCDNGSIVLTVDGELAIPTECNGLTIEVLEDDTARRLDVIAVEFPDSQTFPVDVLIKPDSTTARALQMNVVGTLDEEPVAETRFFLTWTPRKINRGSVALEPLQ